jgi:hypothetical protein
MNTLRHSLRALTPILGASFIFSVTSIAEDHSVSTLKSVTSGSCDDSIVSLATVVPDMDCKFFRTTETSYHAMIVEDESGHLEDTVDGRIDADDLLRIEHTAHCISSHQGEHLMNFCDAVTTTDGIKLHIWGGIPAYASSLSVTIDADRHFNCDFEAIYPAPTNSLSWKIKKKSMQLKSQALVPGSRIHGWISVIFDEIDEVHGVTGTFKIEGHFKPVIVGESQGDPEASEPTGADQPASPPKDESRVKGQTPNPNPKNGPGPR